MNKRQKEMLQDLLDSKNNQIKEYKSVLNEIREYIEKQIKFLCEIDGQNIPLNDSFKFCSMNELYQTGKYSGFKEVQEKLEEILDKVDYL